VYPTVPGSWTRAADDETTFPTTSGNGRQVSTTPGNRLFPASVWYPAVAPVSQTHSAGRFTLEVQIFGIKKSADTRKALRFFSERRIRTHFVDLVEKPASVGELRRFAQKFGVMALVDKESRRFDELGLRYAQMSDERWLARLAEEPMILRLPLVRSGNQVMIGADEAIWRVWMVDRKS
jgi:arsenate reductase-like glutaredoxin family protein